MPLRMSLGDFEKWQNELQQCELDVKIHSIAQRRQQTNIHISGNGKDPAPVVKRTAEDGYNATPRFAHQRMPPEVFEARKCDWETGMAPLQPDCICQVTASE